MSLSNARRLDYDLMRVISMLGVVYLHSAAGVLRQLGTPLWHFSNVISSLATVAVPLFFMLSGALLLNQEQTADLKILFRKRLPKILLPLVAWSAVIVCLKYISGGPQAALGTLLPLLNTPAMVPYWFLYALVPMYLISPLLKKMADGLSDAHWNYLIGLWLVCTIGWSTVTSLLPDGSLKTALTQHWTLNLNFIGGYLGYFLLGARLAKLKKLPARSWLWGGSALLFVIIAIGTAWLSTATGAYDERFKSYLHLFAALLAALLFLLVRSYGQNRRSGRVLTGLSALSFGIYLIHPPAIRFWEKAWTHFMGSVTTIPLQLGFYLAILASCMLGAFVLSSIKPLCWLFTGQNFSAACRDCNLFSLLQRCHSQNPG